MAYMVYQQYVSAIREAYAQGTAPELIAEHVDSARRAREWIESLAIDPALRASLAEPIATLEDAFAGLLRIRATRP